MTSTEQWRDIAEYYGVYQVSDAGRVRSIDRVDYAGRRLRGKILRPAKGTDLGHLHVVLHAGDGGRPRHVHRLVLEAFVGTCPPGMEACHNDGTPSNNARANLRWDTRKANHADRVQHGTHYRGEQNPAAKLQAGDIERIFDMTRCGCTRTAVASWFGVSPSMVCRILSGRAWRHLGLAA